MYAREFIRVLLGQTKKKKNIIYLGSTKQRSISSNIPKFDDDAVRASFTAQAPLETKTMCGRIARGDDDASDQARNIGTKKSIN